MKRFLQREVADGVLVPLAWYMGVNLLLSLLNGTPFDAQFRQHAVTVLIVAAAVAGGWLALRRFRERWPRTRGGDAP